MKEFDRKRELRRYLVGLAVGLSLFICLRANQVRPSALFDRDGLKSAADMLQGLLHPNLSSDFLYRVLQLSCESLFVGLLGTILAAILGTALALIAIKVPELPDPPVPRNLWQSISAALIRWVSRFVLGFFRGIPEIVWAYAFVRILGLGPGAAVLAIALTVGGSIGKLFCELAEAVDPRIIGGLRSAGASRWGIILHGILPQVRKQWVAYALFRMECNIRTGTILGVVGAGGLGSEIALSIRYFQFDRLATTLLAVLAFVVALEVLSSVLRRVSIKWSLAFGIIGGAVSFHYLDIPWADLLTGNLNGIWASATFELSFTYLGHVAVLMFRTVLMAWAATILAAVVAFLVAPLSTKTLLAKSYLQGTYQPRGWSRFLQRSLVMTTKMALQTMRAMPELTLALLFVVWVGPGAFAGILAIAIHNVGVISRLYTDVYEEVEPGPPRSLESSGSGPLTVWLFGVLPQVAARLVAFTLYRFEVNLRATITVGFVGAGGAGDALNNAIALFHMGDLTILLAVMLIFVTALDYAGDRLRQRILTRRSSPNAKLKRNALKQMAQPALRHLPPVPITGPNILYYVGSRKSYGQGRILELSPTGMTITCSDTFPSGLVVRWFARHGSEDQPLEGLAKIANAFVVGDERNCDHSLSLEFVYITRLQLEKLREIAATHGVRLRGWDSCAQQPRFVVEATSQV